MPDRTTHFRSGLLGLFLACGVALPADSAWLEGGDPPSLEAGAPLEIRLDPAELDYELAFVVDDVDVTGFAQRQGDRVTITLPMQLTPGPHVLTVYVRTTAGYREQALPFEVFERAYFFETAAQVDGQLTHRVIDNALPITPELDRTEGTSAIQWLAEYQRGPWQATAYAPVIYDSAGKTQGGLRHWDVANYLGTLRRGPVSFQAGEHGAAAPSLILQGFHRRGISGRVEGPGSTYATGFMFRTEPITGFRERFGFDDSRNRLTGGSVGTESFRLGDMGELSASATWLQATGGEGGAGTAGLGLGRVVERGEARDGALELRLFDGGLLLGGEWARTRFDFDGGGGVQSIVAHAWQFYGEIAPFQGVEFFGHAFDARFFYQESETDPFFRSLGNPGAPNDLHDWNARFDTSWAGFAFAASLSRLQDNVDDVETATTYRDETWSFDASYTPVVTGEAPAWRTWIGLPTLQIGWSRNRSKPIANKPEPIPFFNPFPIIEFFEVPLFNGTTRTSYAAVQTSYERLTIGVNYTYRRFDETSSPFEDQISKSSSANLQWQIHDRVGISVDGNREVTRFRDPAFKTTTKRVGFGLSHRILPDRVEGILRADWQRSQDSIRSVDSRDLLLSAQTNFIVRRPEGNRPGLAFALLGTYRDVIDEVNRLNRVDGYQVFARVDLTWSPRKSWGQRAVAGRAP